MGKPTTQVAYAAVLSGLLACAVLMLAMIVGPIAPSLRPWLATAGVVVIAFMCWGLRTVVGGLRQQNRDMLSLRQEVAALNEHAMVTLTDETSRVHFVNDKFIRTLGFAKEQIIGRLPTYFYAESDRIKYDEINRTLCSGGTWTGEVVLRCADGRHIITQTTVSPRLDSAGRWKGSVAVRTDITESRLAAATRDNVAALHNLADPVLIVDPADGLVSYANAAALLLLDWDTHALSSRTMADLPFVIGDLAAIQPATSAKDLRQIPFSLGERHYVAELQRVTLDLGAERVFVLLHDVTEARALEQLKHDFVSNVSHELRTPLTSIKGALGLVLSGAAGEVAPRAESMLQIAQRNAERLVLIVNDILDLEKISAGKMAFDFVTRDLRDALEEANRAVAAYSDQFDVRIRTDVPDHPVFAAYDFDRMLQVLTNLISNACKFSRPNTEVVVSLLADDKQVVIKVEDTGVGIPESALETIFDRFSQAGGADRREKGGTGLGLSIVKAIVENHGGTVTLQSELNVGTSVSITLQPVAMPEQVLAQESRIA